MARARSLEPVRFLLAAAGGLILARPFLHRSPIGIGDAHWYAAMLADFVTQWRAGVFPVFVGQSEHAFNGAVSPLRLAPYFQHLGGVLDLLTGRRLGFYALQNLALVLSLTAAAPACYGCAAALAPARRWSALALALLYVSSPAVLSLLYTGNLFMSVMALPFLPLGIYGLWRAGRRPDGCGPWADAAWLALPAAAAWWCHAPIALWLCAVITLGLMLRFLRGGGARLASALPPAALLFVLTAGFVFVSVATLHAPETPGDRFAIMSNIRLAFPACLLPVSASAGLLGDYQVGWSLWALLLGSALLCLRKGRRSAAVLVLPALFLVPFLLPVPGLTFWLWHHALPQAVCDITFLWPAQRLPVLLAALAVLGAAAAFASIPARWSNRLAIGLFLAAALAWNGREAAKFLRRGRTLAVGPAEAARVQDPGNALLTRYAFDGVRPVPAYYSHGYMDPYLANRILAPDRRAVRTDNRAVVRPPDEAPSVPLRADYNGVYHFARLSPALPIAGDQRYALRLELRTGPFNGTLAADGRWLERQYFLPDSAFGMVHAVPTRSYGFTPSSSDFFPVWTADPAGDEIALTLYFAEPYPAAVPADAGRAWLQAYDPLRLPIRIDSWTPYRASTPAVPEGAWLETPRVWLDGYRATANGRPAELAPTPNGLVGVRLEAGPNRVILRYPGPLLLRAAYFAGLATWAAAAVLIARGLYRGGKPARRSTT